MAEKIIIGVLALQGDFEAHQKMLERLGVNARRVRSAAELADVDGLILPGGESTVIGKLMERVGLDRAIVQRAQAGMPLYGTCAGLILMAQRITDSEQARLGLFDITVTRNAFGRQQESFEANISVPALGETPLRGVFIRAPYVSEADASVEVLARYEDRIVAVRQGTLLGSAFHPELTDDMRLHAMFVEMAATTKEKI